MASIACLALVTMGCEGGELTYVPAEGAGMGADATSPDSGPAPDLGRPPTPDAELPDFGTDAGFHTTRVTLTEPLSANTSCFELADGESLASVSPEGHAWLVSGDDQTTLVRVIDPLVPTEEVPEPAEVDIPSVTLLRAWDGRRASVLTGRTLWELRDLRRTRVTPPDGLSDTPTFCGDVTSDALILSDGRFFAQRDARWWQWLRAAQVV